MIVPKAKIELLSSERSLQMRMAAARTLQELERFSGSMLEYGPIALQLLDEWIDRLQRRGPISSAARMQIIALLGQTLLQTHSGDWVIRIQGEERRIGVICLMAGQSEPSRFVDVVRQVNRRLSSGIGESLAFFYLITSIELRGNL
jgi:hypothetical protein